LPSFFIAQGVIKSEDSTQILWKLLKNLLLIRSLCQNIKWTSFKQKEKSNFNKWSTDLNKYFTK
jgi:hypothetical protein